MKQTKRPLFDWIWEQRSGKSLAVFAFPLRLISCLCVVVVMFLYDDLDLARFHFLSAQLGGCGAHFRFFFLFSH